MAPASVDSRQRWLEEVDVEENLCKECTMRGERNVLRYLQINDEVAVFVCDSEKCTALPSLVPGCQIIIQRRASDITYLRRRKRRAGSLPSSNIETVSTAPKTTSGRQDLPTMDPFSREQFPLSIQSPLPTSSVIQWSNEGNMCWLDVSMLLLIQSGSLRQCHQALGATSILKRLCDGFDEAQQMVANKLHADGSRAVSPTGNNVSNAFGQVTGMQGLISTFSNGQSDNTSQLSNTQQPRDFLEDFLESTIQSSTSNTSRKHLLNGTAKSIFNLDEDTVDTNENSISNETFRLAKGNSSAAFDSIHQELGTLDLSSSQTLDVSNTITNATSTTALAAAIDLLRQQRQEIFEAIKPKMQCEEGKHDSPVTTIASVLRLDGPTEEHFTTRYRREFYCYACGFTNVTVHRHVVIPVSCTTSDFSMHKPTVRHPCPKCKAEGQISRIVYHSIPTCPLVHFGSGLQVASYDSWLPSEFKHHGVTYHLTSLVQYQRNPDHFIIWIRDVARNMWLECNDLAPPVCQWTCGDPPIPPDEVHILSWEREGGHCKACVSLQEQMFEIEDEPISADFVSKQMRRQTSQTSLPGKVKGLLPAENLQVPASVSARADSYQHPDSNSAGPGGRHTTVNVALATPTTQLPGRQASGSTLALGLQVGSSVPAAKPVPVTEPITCAVETNHQEIQPANVHRSSWPLTAVQWAKAGNHLASDKEVNSQPGLTNIQGAKDSVGRFLPGSNAKTAATLLSIGTPPHSPEFSKPVTKSQTKPAAANRKSALTLKEIGAMWKSQKNNGKEVTDQKTPAKISNTDIPYAIAKNFISGNTGDRRGYEKKGRMGLSGILGEIPRQIITRLQTRRDATSPTPSASQDSVAKPSQNPSLSRMLRSANQFPPTKSAKKRELPAKPQEQIRPPTPPKKLKKLKIPKRKFDNFNSFKQKSGKFSGFLKKDAMQDNIQGQAAIPARNQEPEQEQDKLQADQYQSSVLLTPSSSVSSPSACSESSLQNENTAPHHYEHSVSLENFAVSHYDIPSVRNDTLSRDLQNGNVALSYDSNLVSGNAYFQTGASLESALLNNAAGIMNNPFDSVVQNETICLSETAVNGMGISNAYVDDSNPNLSNTMDTLCQALEVTSHDVQPQSVGQATNLMDDYKFLEGLLS